MLRAIVQRLIRRSRRAFVQDHLNNCKNVKAWWKRTNQLIKPSKQVSQSAVIVDGKRLNGEDMANNLNIYYKSIRGDVVVTPITSHSTINTPIEPVSIGEVKSLIKQLDTSKSTSTEDFPTWVTKLTVEDICIPITDIINCMLSTSTYPDKWKSAQVVPVPKTSQPTHCKVYRPISLLYRLGKLSEQVIVNKIKPRLDEIIDMNQYAYRTSLGTTDAMLHFVHTVTKSLDSLSTSFVQCAFLDFSKAFDCLQPQILLQKMHYLNFNNSLISLVSDFLTNRKQCVRFNSYFSTYLDICVGAPQGTKLGPIF